MTWYFTPIYKGWKSNQLITNGEKLWKDHGLRIYNFGSKMINNCRAEEVNIGIFIGIATPYSAEQWFK